MEEKKEESPQSANELELARKLHAVVVSTRLGVTLPHAYNHYSKHSIPDPYYIQLAQRLTKEVIAVRIV